MRILFLTQRFPFPPDRGDRIRSYHILRHLAVKHEISLATLADEDIREDHWKELSTLCSSIDVGRIDRIRRKIISLAYLPTTTPLTLPNYYSKELKDKVNRRLRGTTFDLIFIYCSSMAPYVLECDRIPKVVDFVDVDSEKWFDYARSMRFPMNLPYLREGYLLRRFEMRVAQACRHAFVSSRREKEIFDQFMPDTPISAICNGVGIPENIGTRRTGYRMIFTGVMDYWPNEDAVCHFVNDVFPIISEKIPEAELLIVGQKPTRRVRNLSKIKGVTVTGWVTDTHKYMDEASVFVAPIRVARGIQNKVLEAMANGMPVVATKAAADGLEALEDRDFLLGNSPREFADKTVRLFCDSSLRKQLARSALEYIRERHDWTVNIGKMESVLLGVVESKMKIRENVT